VAAARQRRKKGLTMTIKERLEIHRQIEQENKQKLNEWKERRKAA
jgi:hypothetical protein